MSTQAITNTVARMLNRGRMLDLALSVLKQDSIQTNESLMGDKIKSLVKRGEEISDSEKIELANYVLEYHTNYSDIANTFLVEFEGINK